MRKKVVQLRCNNVAKMLMPAFSLVEMLMALLVASLLLAALAPVMTKRMGNENVNVSGVGRNTSENFAVFDDVSKNGTDDNSFTIPNNAINVRISMIGGGGAGGSATFGSKIIISCSGSFGVLAKIAGLFFIRSTLQK